MTQSTTEEFDQWRENLESQLTEKKDFRPSCVNCRQVRNCIIAKAVRDFKGHIQTIGLHCMDWGAEG
jgi:hypothetical protein